MTESPDSSVEVETTGVEQVTSWLHAKLARST